MYVERTLQIVNAVSRPDLALAGRRLHFLHVPKSGGTTLRYALEGYAAVTGLTSANEARRVDGVRPTLDAAEVVMGHQPPVEGLSREDTCYITVLRHPVERLRSLVGMIAARLGREPKAVVDDLSWTQANWTVHLLTGATGPEGDPVAEAKRLLEARVHIFGFQGQFLEFMALLAATLEIDGLIYPSFQYTPERKRMDDRFDDRLETLSVADRELFEFAAALYRRRFQPAIDPQELQNRVAGRTYLRIRAKPGDQSIDVSQVRFS